MSNWQQNELVATIRPKAAGELTVHVARWPGHPDGRLPKVMWIDMGQYRYLPPDLARAFAAALTRAADQIDQEAGP